MRLTPLARPSLPAKRRGSRFARAGGHGAFSYSKCDSFSLALALYDALLPASNKFIGSEACSRCHFSTATLRASFPLSLGPVPAVSSAAPACTGCTAAVESSDASATLLVTVLIEMMKDNKADRLSAQDALRKISKGVEHKSSV
ncbi:hypothetical protein Pelo_19451 [Pelomyxa schiedti]|nr:hypothetical protein Pelo_19451 [Pelomyxa schiedti]